MAKFSVHHPLLALALLSCLPQDVPAEPIPHTSSFVVLREPDARGYDPWSVGPELTQYRRTVVSHVPEDAAGSKSAQDEQTGTDLCPTNLEVRDLCQRCSKRTKDPKAFRMCCSNSMSARVWCAAFLDFGLN